MRENLKIGKYVVIEEGCEIGDNVTIGNFVTIKKGTKIGDGSYIHDGARIGCEGQQTVEYKGIVDIGKNVDIGSNTNIYRGSVRDTVIGDGTHIAALCQISHDVQIGRGCKIRGAVQISGHVDIGNKVRISPQVCISNRIKIGDGAWLRIGSLVLRDVRQGEVVVGRPAMKLNEFRKMRDGMKRVFLA